MFERGAVLALALVLLLAAAARLYHLDAQSLWFDEAATLGHADASPWEIWGADTHPPLYYLLMSLWRLGGESTVWMRLSSVLFSLGTVWVVFRTARCFGGVWIATLAGLLQALSPFAVRYAQELRMYALLECAVAVALMGLLMLLRDPVTVAATPLRWRASPLRSASLCYGLGTLVALYSHNMAFLWPLVANVIVVLAWIGRPERGRLARRWLAVNLLVLLLWALYWPALLQQAGAVQENFWLQQPDLWPALLDLSFLTLGARPHVNYLDLAILAGLLTAALLGLAGLRPRALALALGLTIALPPLLEAGLVLLVRPLFMPRTLIWIGPPMVLAMAFGFAALWRAPPPRRWLRLGVVGAALLLVIGRALFLANDYDKVRNPDWRGLAIEIARLARPDDRLVVSPSYEDATLGYYTRRMRAAGEPAPPATTLRLYAGQEAELLALARSLRPGQRIWVLRSPWMAGMMDDPAPLLARKLPCLLAPRTLPATYLFALLVEAGPDCVPVP